MSKEVETKVCTECESAFKLTYDRTKTNGMSKFCPFCSNELGDEPEED